MKDEKPAIIQKALATFATAESQEIENRRAFRDDIEFARLSRQWPRQIEQQRQQQQRPCLTINKVAPVIRQVVNDSRLNRPSISVRPVDSNADKETAEIITGLIRNIEQSSDADTAYDTAIDNAVSGGFGYFRINLDYANDIDPATDLENVGAEAFEQDIVFERIVNSLSVYGDPNSRSATSDDWNEAFVFEDMPKAEFESKYPGKVSEGFNGGVDNTDWLTDNTVRVAEYWLRERTDKAIIAVEFPDAETQILLLEDYEKRKDEIGELGGQFIGLPRTIPSYKVTQYILTAAEVLEEKPWPGRFIPIIPVYGDEVFWEGRRYFRSIIRDAKDANRMFNYWRTTTTELVALAPKAPFIGRKGAFETDAAKWNTAHVETHAYIEFDGPDMPQRQPFAGVPAGALQEALNAADDIKATTGIYDASLGAPSNETSGKAINARQREGDVSSFHFIDNLSRAIRHAGRIVLDLIPKVYSTPRIIRVLGEDGEASSVPINGMRPHGDGDGTEESEAREIQRIYDLRIGRYDLAVTSGPSFTTRREEAATQMMELIRSYPDAAPVIGDLLAKNLDWPGSDEIAKRLEGMLPPQARDGSGQLPPKVQQQIQQMTEAIQVLHQKLQESESRHNIDSRKVDVDEYKAETERMQALQPAMTPEDIQAIVIRTLSDLLSDQELPQGEGQAMPTGMTPEQMGLAA